MEGMSHLEPLKHSVLNAARGNSSRMEASVCEPLEHSVRMMTLNDSPMEKNRSKCRRDQPAYGRGASSAPVQCPIMTMGLARGLRTEDGLTAVWSRPRTDIVKWSPRYGDL